MLENNGETKKELININEDLENYFANTIIPQLYVDSNFILRKFTPPAMSHFSLSEKDIDKHIKNVKDNIKYPTILENIEEVMTTNEILEKEVQTTDGKWFQMNILPYFVRREKKTNGVIITFVDITQRITALNKLEKLNSINETMVYTLTHDLRQPLSALVLLADVLVDNFEKQDKKEFMRMIDIFKNSTKNMISLVKDFGENSKDDISSADERINIEDIFLDITLALKDEIYKNNVTFSTDFETSEIIFSRKDLRSILYNLLNNAIKFKKSGKPLEIKVSTKKLDDYVILRVKDNGMGIAKDNLEKVFKRSTRLNKDIEGTGMGLYIVKRIIENKDGKIEINSTLGKGSEFKVYFKSGYEGEPENKG